MTRGTRGTSTARAGGVTRAPRTTPGGIPATASRIPAQTWTGTACRTTRTGTSPATASPTAGIGRPTTGPPATRTDTATTLTATASLTAVTGMPMATGSSTAGIGLRTPGTRGGA